MNHYETHVMKDPAIPCIFHLNRNLPPHKGHSYPNWHENVEILHITRGRGIITADTARLDVRAGDIVVVESISRIARNTRDLLSIVSDLTARQVEFVSLKENIDTTTPQGRFMLTVFGALAELERENILERQREGIEIAKGAGKYKGRKPLGVDETQFKAVCTRWRAGEITARAAMQELGLKPNTFYRRVKELEAGE